ncbi:MAG: polyisoprenoid-binding protein [Nitrospiraceae bacterium]|nr:MAG: polyisoprenoid-binding protein [Nitrospiraceae bacterium]
MAKWIVDSDHSVAAFSIRHMMIANVRGQFTRITGTILYDPAEIRNSSVDIVIEAAIIVTGILKRDDHLRSPDFLDVNKYPVITFRSTGIEPVDAGHARVTGDVTIHGTTRQITVEAEFSGPVKDPFGDGVSMGFTTSATLNREDFGITWNQPMEGDGIMLGKEVRLFIDLEADRVSE